VEILTGEPIAFASLTATHMKNEAIKANMATDATSTIRAVGCLDSISIANEKGRLELHDVFQGATDRDSFYTLALPYRDSVLAGYTENMISLLQQVITQ
jgi:hypothetical protein